MQQRKYKNNKRVNNFKQAFASMLMLLINKWCPLIYHISIKLSIK